MGDPHSNPNTMRTFALACVFLAVAITALPADDLVAEALPADTEVAAPDTELYVQQLHKEASNDVAALIEAGKTKDACAKLADSSIKEITDGQRNTQRLVNRMDVGKNCHTAGLAAYNAAKSRETSARNAYHSANNAYNRAKGARVKISPFTVSKVKANGCLDVSKDRAYLSAKRKVTSTGNDKIRKKAAYDSAKKSTASALKAHQKAKVACACRAQKNHKAAVKSTHNFNSSKNAKAWTKAYHMKCVLDGKPANKCAVPRVPRVTAPSMPSWVARLSSHCDAERKAKERSDKKAAKERSDKAAHRERTSKHTERKNKAAHRERTSKQNKERQDKHNHRERTGKANEKKAKNANSCVHGAIIYQHYHFRGYGRRFYKGRYDMHAMMRKGVKNDDASSAKVYNGCKLIIYQHSRFNGRSATYECNHGSWCNFDYNHFTRRGVGNDQMSSLKVCNKSGSGC